MNNHVEWTPELTARLERLWLDGMSLENIGDALGCSRSTIARRIKDLGKKRESIWTPSRDAMVRAMANDGAPLSKIARAISEDVGSLVSRSSVAGRCARSGITIQSFEAMARRDRLKRKEDLATGEARIAAVVNETPPHDSLRSVEDETGEEESVTASPVSIEELFEDAPAYPPRVTIIELTNVMCHWVTDDAVADVLPGYCGDPVAFNTNGLTSVYCRAHHTRAYYQAPKVSRSVTV